LPDSSVDLLVSNCVLNLSTDKEQVFKEIFRVLRHGGRMVISDIVADRDIKPEDRQDAAAWADCTLGTLSLRQFLESISQTGFIGLAQLDEKMWQEIKGYHLSSLTLQAHKFQTDCHATLDHLAIYLGPFAEVSDDLGNSYKRFKLTAIRGDVARFLQKGASGSSFIVVAGSQAAAPHKAQTTGSECCGTCGCS
jgi:SAM-dependent methyltransferase